jgi:alpha-L-rhamnosidase
MVERGATTLWEQWNGYCSQIHSCFASVGGWFHNGLAGMQPDPAMPGFKHFFVRPAMVSLGALKPATERRFKISQLGSWY